MNYNELGIQAIQEENYEKAAELFNKAIEENPEESIGFINFGNLLASMNENERAERFFQKAITLDEKAATAFYSLANLYYNTERFEEAAKLYEKAITNGIEGPDAYFMLGKSFQKIDQTKLALPYLQRAYELDETQDIQIKLTYGIALASLEMFDVAEPIFKEILELDPENADAHYNMGVLYAVSTSDTESALKHLKAAFTIQPNYDQARYVYDMISLRN
ncbi:tetratricopeptide repeat protein [Psychrobacillus sp. MER TA 171]|uniref:tetratricopeptide repeat protein n=1 Tax=Psychrobacillus sp. MER TA 171 TaxID=2939577 RepID=UPI00203AD20E|nr:tetratricopeptide repeat protein [Psychrobacillus sp. MER TA 171]MCM3358456.1 tetratricopeptide repeat protein [Psychrobacillus sp. MER TA 171]